MPCLRTLLAALLIGAGGCSATDAVAPLPIADLQAAPIAVAVGGQVLVLVPLLWRDFQPVSPPDGQPLVASLRVQAANGTAFTAAMRVDAAWVVNGAEVWAAKVDEERLARSNPAFYEVFARDGPKWGPGVRVDVVVRIREESGATHLLRAPGALILRTD